jgi:hypothetical protein
MTGPVPDAKEGARVLDDIRHGPAGIGPDVPARVGKTVRLARAVRTRWRVLFLVTGAVLSVLGVTLASDAVLVPGVLLLLTAVLYGIGSSGCTSAGRVALARVRSSRCGESRRRMPANWPGGSSKLHSEQARVRRARKYPLFLTQSTR